VRTRTLIATFESPDSLQAALLDDQPHGGRFYATLEDFQLGETIITDVRLPRIPEGVPLIATVVWRRRPTAWRSSLVPGIGVSFHRDSRPQHEFLSLYARGSQTQKRKNGARCAISVPVEVGVAGIPLRAMTANLSRGGLYVPAEVTPPVGQPVEVTLLPGELTERADSLDGRIVWTSAQSPFASPPGFAVSFAFRSPVQRRRLEMLVGAREAEIYVKGGMARQTMRW